MTTTAVVVVVVVPEDELCEARGLFIRGQEGASSRWDVWYATVPGPEL